MGSFHSSQESELKDLISCESIEESDSDLLFDFNDFGNSSSQQPDGFSEKLTSCVENCLEGRLKNLKTLNLICAGITGAGKSTLINNLFRDNLAQEGFGKSITEQIKRYNKPGLKLNIYDTPGLELTEIKQKELLKGIAKIHNTKDISEMLHCMLYCVKSESQRFQEAEKEFIIKFTNQADLKKIPIIIVITQTIDTRTSNRLKEYIESLNLNVVGVVPVLAKRRELSVDDNTIEKKAFGLEELIGIVQDNLPERLQETLNNVEKASLKHKRNCSIGAIAGAVTASAVVGANPVPLLDIVLLIPIEIGMLAGITVAYGIKVSSSRIQLILSFTFYNGAASILGRTAVVDSIKCAPGIGSLIGGVISGSSAAFLTAAIGATYTSLLDYIIKENIDINSLDPDELKDIVQPIFKEKMGND